MTETRKPKPTIGVAVIALNEADRIGRLLESLDFADDILVVDSGSSDDTVEVCRTAGARVTHHPWRGYAAQKQFAMEHVSGDWALNLDADEAVSPELAREMLARVADASSEIAGFSMPRLSRYLNRWIRHGGWYPDRKTRLVRKGNGRWKGQGVHEVLEVQGRVEPLEGNLLHYVYRGVDDQVNTINRFSSVFASYAPSKRSRLNLYWGIFHAVGKFLECAVWKRGLLDGPAGLIIAVNSSFYVFLKHAKTWEAGLGQVSPQPGKRSEPVMARRP